jgi:hypothetical protein
MFSWLIVSFKSYSDVTSTGVLQSISLINHQRFSTKSGQCFKAHLIIGFTGIAVDAIPRRENEVTYEYVHDDTSESTRLRHEDPVSW